MVGATDLAILDKLWFVIMAPEKAFCYELALADSDVLFCFCRLCGDEATPATWALDCIVVEACVW